MSRARILVMSFSKLESDPRVLKQIALLQHDYDVETCGHGPAPDGVVAHHRIPDDRVYWRYPRMLVVLRQYRRAYRMNPVVSWVAENVPEGRYDVVLANDVDAIGAALALKPRKGVHADLHEFAPLQNTEMLRFRLFVAPFMRWQLKTFARAAASTSTVGPALARRFRRDFGFEPFVVMNAPPFAASSAAPTTTPLRLVHAGAALRNRRLETLVEAVALLPAAVRPTLDLYLAPNDPGYLAELTRRAAEVEGVRVLEPVPFRDLIPTLHRYDIGLHVLAPTNFNNAYALPNKFFEYVQARIGVIIGPSPEMRGILEDGGFGAVSDDFSPEALAKVLARLDAETVAEWKRRADEAAPSLSAGVQTQAWADAIARLAS
jgi:hypothetical protein